MRTKSAVLAVAVGLAAPVLASQVHLKPPNSEPTFTDNGLTLTGHASVAGLGNGDLLIKMTARANPTSTCTNPAGATQPPGQNPAPVDVTGATFVPASQIKNGNVSFGVTTAPPTTPLTGAPDCPNTQWTEAITDMAFTSATITIEQPPGTIVLTIQCTFSSPTVNGPVPAANVTCDSF